MNLLHLFDSVEDVEEYKAGHILFKEGEPGGIMYVVLLGELEVKVGDHPVAKCGPGDMVGELSLIDATARSATAVVTKECCLAPVDQKLFLSMVQKTPHFALHVMTELARRLRHMNQLAA